MWWTDMQTIRQMKKYTQHVSLLLQAKQWSDLIKTWTSNCVSSRQFKIILSPCINFSSIVYLPFITHVGDASLHVSSAWHCRWVVPVRSYPGSQVKVATDSNRRPLLKDTAPLLGASRLGQPAKQNVIGNMEATATKLVERVKTTWK